MSSYTPVNKAVLRRPVESALDAPVGMVDQAAEILVPPHPYRHLESIEGKIGTQVIRNLPAQDTAGEQIHHESGIHPAGKRLDIGDVRDPAAVRRRRVEAPLQQVRRPVRRIPG